jgi:sulfhydrogenase subunit gamma (sulfur reductase)
MTGDGNDPYGGKNVYVPYMATVTNIQLEAGGGRPIKTFTIKLDDEEDAKRFVHKPGQFSIISSFGKGESVFAINSVPNDKGILEVSVMKVGNVTERLHELAIGDKVGVRGPFGNSFPVDEWKGKNMVFVGAGIGISPVASVYRYVLDPEHRKDFGDVTLIYGARTPADFAFKDEFEGFGTRDDLDLWLCIDWKFGPKGPTGVSAGEGWPAINMASPGETEIPEGVNKFTCFVPQLVEVVKPSFENSIVVTCGPPIAIKFITQALAKLGWDPSQIYTTLENRMKCGIGKCGRCNIGEIYVCKQGPVFTYEEIQNMSQEF